MTQILAWALKRSAFARLQQIVEGTIPPPPGTELLTASGVQAEVILPASPDRICVYGTPIRSTRRQATAENTNSIESVTLEIRLRIYQPGEQDEDVGDVDRLTEGMCNAVATALIDGHPIVDQRFGNLNLSTVTQWPTAVTPMPEAYVMGLASIIFAADLVTT